ncbi:HAMP domain-containing histidine kinase [Dysgonomonadaceae bacterium zrk40]|nr:HAMP domain-containing histidine kinase [Dysgonomonadaceae bacterium zrk40]
MVPRKTLTYLFVILATFVGVLSLLLSGMLVKELSQEERQKMEVWAKAAESISRDEPDADMSLVLSILQGNSSIPAILHDEQSDRLVSHNIRLPKEDTAAVLRERMVQFSRRHEPVKLTELNQTLYFDDSYTLKQLQLFPYIQLFVIALFVALAFFALNRSQRAEQNSVWVGLSKETAHQLGTPISSLVAWTEYMKLKEMDAELLAEIEKDTNRLQMIAERFARIGSATDLQVTDVREEVKETLSYLGKRLSDKITFSLLFPSEPVLVSINKPLFGWVIENLTKNAADAMRGEGAITFSLTEKKNRVMFDVTDSGKGIPRANQKKIFTPGYTTKERGWGLGLALVKRIVQVQHKGEIFVLKSEPGKGATFRIILRKTE